MKVKPNFELDNVDFNENPTFDPIAQIEMDLLLDAVARRYGYDFSQYSNKMLCRRLSMFRNHYKAKNLSELIPRLLYDQEVMGQLLRIISVTVTEFFRDPKFFLTFKQQVVPLLHTYAFISLWCAGCASGEEAYSWAILLDEAGLLDRSRIYATDINSNVLQEGRTGIYSEEIYLKACNNYQLMGGTRRFDDYCRRSYGAIKMADRLQKCITFARHNLVHDGVFGEMVVVSCRNVMIYFGSSLKQRSVDLFHKSLCSQGFLCLGDSETIETTNFSSVFQPKDKCHRIYQKMPELKE
ncbi:protein-glutamate O-methyltransferase CheR [Cellvibrio sp. KY-GH-1]|uniref:CheR family methyltransferase n=1 Tax=Cellvibrio sp. KY-GH-1 TaxID=2303332 RepID=UPI001244DFE9|nr:protein-glutamate O-methyltransferase CheR [Cellvibrio sp. KY-GH-1]QEY15270.1 protein-glutamate O-methyltransferase CheR [Cellvibrio sp. KY-GH-1]